MKAIGAYILALFMLGCSSHLNYMIASDEAISRTIEGAIPESAQYSNLSQDEIYQVERMIEECVPRMSRSLRRYRYQYLSYMNQNGDKMVWVNAFCSNEEGWQDDIVVV